MTKKEYQQLLDRYRAKTESIKKATLETLQRESSSQQEARVKKLLRPENYALFFDYYFGAGSSLPLADCLSAPFHVDIYKDLYNKDFITLFNLIFRGGAKSTHGNLGYPFALKQSGKAKFFLVVGANEVRATMLLQDLQVQLEHNTRIIDDFGPQKAIGSWADGQFETTDRCTFMSIGIDQPARGLRNNGVRLEYVSIDDIEDPKRAMNTELCNEYANKVTGDIQGAFSINSERTIINNNYFVEKGFISELLKRKGFDMKRIDTRKNNVIKRKDTHLYQINLTDVYYTRITDPSVVWTPSWNRFTREYCLRKVQQYEFDQATISNEYYNTPVKVGKLFKPEQIRWVKARPLKDYDLIIDFLDLSYTSTGDTKANVRLGCKDGTLTLLKIFCRNCDMETALSYHYLGSNKVTRQNPNYAAFYDANVAQKAIYTPVFEEAAQRYHSYNIPQPTHNGTDKYTKISTILGAAFGNKTLVFAYEVADSQDWEEASFQLFGFEKGTKIHDDFPDALSECVAKCKELYGYPGEPMQPIITKHRRGGY